MTEHVAVADAKSASIPSPDRGLKHLLVPCLLLMLATVAVYWPVLGYDFVDYDDGDYVVANSHVQAGLTPAGIAWAFRSGHASNWHPLTWVSHMLDISLFGQKAAGHHFTNLALHCVNSLLVFGLLWRMTRCKWRSLLVAALFALHPLHVESVAWISERKDVLSACFGLLSLWAYANYADDTGRPAGKPRKRALQYSLALGFFVLGLLSKPMLVTLPFALFLLDLWPLQRFRLPLSRRRFHSLLIEKLPFLLLSAVSCVITFLVQKQGGAVSSALPLSARVANAVVSYLRYVRKTVWPTDLSVLYPHPGHWPGLTVVVATLFLIVVTVIAVLCWKKYPFLTVGWLWFMGMLVPVIGLVQVGLQSMADRYTYLPLIGLFVAVVWGGATLVARWPQSRPPLTIGGIFMLGGCLVLTHAQVRIWQNSETLFRHAVAVTRNNYLAYNNLGFYLSKKGRVAEAMENYRASLKINPNYEDANNNLGHALAGQRKFTEAIEYYHAALRAAPENVEVHNNLGNALSEIGQLDEAIANYLFVLKKQPDHVNGHNNLGIALAMRGRLDEAIQQFNEALRLNPADASAHGNLGNGYAAQKKFAEATREYYAALKLAPKDDQTYHNLGNVLMEQNRPEEALTNYLAAIALNPNNFGARFRAGYALVRLGRNAEAITQLTEGLRLEPENLDARGLLQRLSAASNPDNPKK